MVAKKGNTPEEATETIARVFPGSTLESISVGGKVYNREPIKLPRWKFEHDVPKFARFLTAARTETQVNKLDPTRKPAVTAMVEDLQTGQSFEIVLGTVLLNLLNERFPNESYVGKSFEMIQHEVPGKAWNAYTLNLLTV